MVCYGNKNKQECYSFFLVWENKKRITFLKEMTP